MSGHSKWAQIKHKKAVTDAKKGQLFSKMVREITIAAKEGGPNPESNPRLRAAQDRARALGLPKDNMERAILRASGAGADMALQEFLYEAAAPGGVMILIEGITDNKNRTLAEIKKILSERDVKLVPQNSLLWNFKKVWTGDGKDYLPNTSIDIPASEREKLTLLLDKLSEQDDVQEVYTNTANSF
ncbi:MAG: YebC/PmpR family DNA-binding transcriptional regulator [Candidatus Sungbacteria bacterium]|nr:YebC/PmpR family DNA-binding transcriptional regulator [Candidatus Sungbacteria bacterium]